MFPMYVLIALALLGSASIKSEEICDCEEKPKCSKGNTATTVCPGGRGMLMVPGGPDCSCCEAVCPRRKGERCDEHRLSCEHGLSCNEEGICGDGPNGVELTAVSATNDSLTFGWRGPSGYIVQYRESSVGKTPGPWQRYEKLTETPESNITLKDLSSGMLYEARALLPDGEGENPVAAIRAETGCECPRPFFKIGTFKGDKFCTEKAMPDKPCCALVICAASQTSEEGSTGQPPMTTLPPSATVLLRNAISSESPMTTTTAAPENNSSSSSCTHKNETYSFGDIFNDGCEHKCTCGEEGKVSCEPRCTDMSHNISSKCVSLSDPKDACCTIVLCDVTLGEQDASTTQGDSEPKNSSEAATTAPTHHHNHHGHHDGTATCTYNGQTYEAGDEFHHGCKSLCFCDPTGEVVCAPIQCPTDSGLDVLDPYCIDWEDVPMDPGENEGPLPTCCPQVRCRSNGSCAYGGQRIDNFAEVPASISDICSGERCFCEFGNITCGGGGANKCPPVPVNAPENLSCKDGGSEMAVLAHPPGDNCCLAWVCPEKAHLPSTQEPGSTNSSPEDPVPETMNPRPDEVTVSTNDKPRPMTTSSSNVTHPEMETGKKLNEVNDTVVLTDRINTSDELTVTSDNSHQNFNATEPAMSTFQNFTIPQTSNTLMTMTESTKQPMQTIPLLQNTTEKHEPITTTINLKEMDEGMTTMAPTMINIQDTSKEIMTPTPTMVNIQDMVKEITTAAATTMNVQEMDKEMTTTTPTMHPIVVDHHSVFRSPWGNILSRPQDGGQPNKKFLPIAGPIQIPDEESSSFMDGENPLQEKKPESYGIPYAPDYQGSLAIRPGKEQQQTPPFNVIHNMPHEIPLGVPHHSLVDESREKFPGHHNLGQGVDNGRLNFTKENPKQQNDNIPIFLRYPVQEGKRQKIAPQKTRIPQHPENIPPGINEFQYQGPFLGIPPSGHDDRIIFQPQGENLRPINNFPRPIGNTKVGNNRQQPPPLRQPVHPNPNIPGVHEGFPGPLLVHHERGPPNFPPQVPGQVQRPLVINGRHPSQNVPTPDQFQIQGLNGEHIPPEVAQHILWALQGRAPSGSGQRVPQHPSQRPPQNHGLPPPRVAGQGASGPQDVFFHIPPGIGPGNPTHPGNIFVQGEEPTHHRNPPRIPQTSANQRIPLNQNGQFASGPPHFLPGVEHSLLPPELYHLAFPPNQNLPNRTQGAATSVMDAHPHMTHDQAHLTEGLPLNQHGTEFGRPPPPPSRFPDVPLHPQLHNVGVTSTSDEILIEATDIMPDSSVHLIFSLPSIFVGLHGQVEISYTEDPIKEDPSTWEGKEIVSTPGDLIESRRLEYTIPGFDGKNGLQPNKNYRLQIVLLLRDLRNSPTSRIIKIRTPPRLQESTTQLPPQIEVDAELGIAEVNATWARFVWRKFNDFELQFIDGVQLRYKEVEGKVYSTTQLLHRATGSYTLEGLRPSSTYEVGLLLVPFPGQKTELLARENLHITTAAEKDPYGFDLKIKVDAVKVFSAEVSWSGVPYPEDKYVNIFRVIYQSDSASNKGGDGSDGADGEERSSTFKVAKRDPSPSALVTGLKPGTRYRMWLEAYLTNGKIKKSDVKDIVTKPSSSASTTKQGKLEASAGEVGKKSSEESGDYYGGLVGVSILAALALVAILILLLMLLKRQGQAKKAAISTARKSESAYDNPTYKTSDHDSTNGRIKNSVRLQEA